MAIVPVRLIARSAATALDAPPISPPPAANWNHVSPPLRTRVRRVASQSGAGPAAVPEAPEQHGRALPSPRSRVRRGVEPLPVIEPEPVKAKRKHHKVDRTGPNWDEHGNYKVGKGRPPVEHQWKKEQSGNPRGPQKKEPLDPLADFDRKVLEPFELVVNGQSCTMTNLDFGFQSLKKAAANGTAKAGEAVIRYCMDAIHRTADRNRTPEVEAWEQQAIDELLQQFGLPACPVVRAKRDDGGEKS